jgi:hypothetical protein
MLLASLAPVSGRWLRVSSSEVTQKRRDAKAAQEADISRVFDVDELDRIAWENAVRLFGLLG